MEERSEILAPAKPLNKRNYSLDLLKLFAMVLVVFWHCMARYIDDYGATPLSNFVWLLQIPLFFIVSGFLSPTSSKIFSLSNLLSDLGKKALFYLWPVFTFLFLKTFAFGYFDRDFGQAMLTFFRDPETGLWFLWVLFWIAFVFDIGVYLSSKTKGIFQKIIPFFVCFFVFALCLFLFLKGYVEGTFLGIRYFIYYLPFYCLGSLYRIFKNITKIPRKTESWIKAIAFFVSLLIFLFEIFYFKSIVSFPDSGIFVFYRVFGSICGCYAVSVGMSLLSKIQFFVFLSRAGKYSLEMYYLHMLFLMLMPPSDSALSLFQQWGMAFGIWAALISITFAVLAVIYFVPFSHLLFFGKSFSFYQFEKKIFKNTIVG